MEQRFGSLIGQMIITSILAVSWITPVLAQQDLLTRAEVYKLLNEVQLLLKDKPPRSAKQADVLVPLDELQTKTRSRAELLFNEGSLARIGSSATFRFKPGLRRFEIQGGGSRAETILELKNGTALVLTPSGSTATRIETPQSRIDVIAAALPANAQVLPPATGGSVVVYHNSITNITQAFNLTDIPVKVSNLDGTQFQFLKAGETVTITNGVIGPVQTFDLGKFYKTSQLAAGLGPGQEALVLQESARVQSIFNQVRKQTLAGFENQKLWIEGLCNLNSRGGASTLSTNCITTNSDDPIRNFEDRRDAVIPPRREQPAPQPELPIREEPAPQPEPAPAPQAPTGVIFLPRQQQ
ncbi:FecR domain-containing protein [Fortiea contorta]|uniref:FecR domain-containing protein n=1 Tax=Fortiea contorta TaxID=1892405 RepID=UPI00034D60B2|nr:FecR domain-containing protein [Fortiea contorta]